VALDAERKERAELDEGRPNHDLLDLFEDRVSMRIEPVEGEVVNWNTTMDTSTMDRPQARATDRMLSRKQGWISIFTVLVPILLHGEDAGETSTVPRVASICRGRPASASDMRESAPAFALPPAWVASRVLAQGRPRGTAVYEKDVTFLLSELEQQAGHFFELKQIDWKAVEKEFRTAVKKLRSDPEHLKLCTRLVARLEDGHAAIIDAKIQPIDESKGRRWTGPRVLLVVIEDKVYVRDAFKNAKASGIGPGMQVAKIDGRPALEWLEKKAAAMRDEGSGFSTDHQALHAACHWGLADWEGTRISFDLVDAKGKSRRKTLVRSGGPNFAPVGPIFPPEGLKTLARQSYGKTAKGFGYIHLRDVPGELPDQLDTMLGAIGEVPGLILDMRANGGGGCDHEAVFGRFLEAKEKWRQYRGQGKRNYVGPIVVIIDAGVRSAGETVAGMLKEDGRAYVIGDTPTAGSSSQKSEITVPSELFSVRFSIHSNKARFNGGKGIEGVGVPPHEVVPYVPAELADGIDTQIRRATEILEKGFPKGAVSYGAKE
jgi:carboxyl-terminal processing protease